MAFLTVFMLLTMKLSNNTAKSTLALYQDGSVKTTAPYDFFKNFVKNDIMVALSKTHNRLFER